MTPTSLEEQMTSAGAGDCRSRQELFVTLYGELRRVADRELRRSSLQSLSPTTLLHETYLNMRDQSSAVFPGRPQFMAYAAASIWNDSARRSMSSTSRTRGWRNWSI